MSTDYLNDLNDSQREAVINTGGPALVIAGAGAGKTRVLTYRIAHLLRKDVPAGNILALTFTNKAANEMKERIIHVVGSETARNLWMGTFHSVFSRILRQEGEVLGYKSNYTIYDSADTRNLIRSIIRELNLDDKIYKPASIASRISTAKNNLVTAGIYSEDPSLMESDKANRMPLLADIYKRYSTRCYKSNTMDFDDLLLNTNILFRDFPDILDKYKKRFRYILVDEYQDTNYSQNLIVRKLASLHRNICVVGDDAQSIYSFRGARIENILEFRNDYPDYTLFKLEQNYRSTQNIVNAANTIIANNTGQIRKTVYSKNETGDKIEVIRAMTDSEEGFNISSAIFDNRFSHRQAWSDYAILYRTNAQSRIFEETLRRKNIPYKIYGGLSFYERKEIKDILAYFRMVVNPEDEEALKRSVNCPKRGIGDTTVRRVFELASSHDVTPWAILIEAEKYKEHFNSGTIKRLAAYVEMINTLRTDVESSDAFTKAKEIIRASGILNELNDGASVENISRLENVEELMNGIKVFTGIAETNEEVSDLEGYMANVALLTDQDNEKEEDRDKVTLMTMHSAKGLEFNNVFIVGMEDTLFPSPMSTGNRREMEEERRLFYVAITRAKKRVTLSYALNRYKWGNLESCRPSRFITEIDPGFLIFPQTGGRPFGKRRYPGEKPPLTGNEPQENLKPVIPVRNSKPDTTSYSTIAPGVPGESFSKGDKVYHERFGEGIVLSVEGEIPDMTAYIDFGKKGKKKLLLRFAKLKKS